MIVSNAGSKDLALGLRMLLFEVFSVTLWQVEHGFCIGFREEKGDRRCETENAFQNVTCTATTKCHTRVLKGPQFIIL